MRRSAKVDNNQNDIVKDLRNIPGVEVEVNHDDILVGFRGKTFWYEIKNPDEVGKNGEIRPSAIQPSQKKLLQNWTGHYRVVWDVQQILDEILK